MKCAANEMASNSFEANCQMFGGKHNGALLFLRHFQCSACRPSHIYHATVCGKANTFFISTRHLFLAKGISDLFFFRRCWSAFPWPVNLLVCKRGAAINRQHTEKFLCSRMVSCVCVCVFTSFLLFSIHSSKLLTAPKIYYTWMVHVLFKAKLTPNKISKTKIKMSHSKKTHNTITAHREHGHAHCTFPKRTARCEDNNDAACCASAYENGHQFT